MTAWRLALILLVAGCKAVNITIQHDVDVDVDVKMEQRKEVIEREEETKRLERPESP